MLDATQDLMEAKKKVILPRSTNEKILQINYMLLSARMLVLYAK